MDRLRDDGLIVVSLVAVVDGLVVGSVVFSDLPISLDDGVVRGVSLAPLAVRPGYQRRGIGAELVSRGLELCADRGVATAIVLGDPAYYGRFGFSEELGRRIESRYSGPGWMALDLVDGALSGVGSVTYPEAFEEV